MPILYILCGPSGCGKSTWTRNFLLENQDFKNFAGTIKQTLIDGFDVIADATHLNEASRHRLTQAIDMYYKDYEIIYVVFNVDVDTCIERNKNREGRANVPENVIRNMCRDFREPSLDEDKRAINIIRVSD